MVTGHASLLEQQGHWNGELGNGFSHFWAPAGPAGEGPRHSGRRCQPEAPVVAFGTPCGSGVCPLFGSQARREPPLGWVLLVSRCTEPAPGPPE